MSDYRPNPEDLLGAVQKMETQRGRLRVFLGMCPGVGKTYSMLKSAQEQQKRGVRVYVGLVETHGRKETEDLLQGLILIPRKAINYRGTIVEEMDIDKILEIKPRLVLVDELAHTNAPGSRHKKRYQDVEELLNQGIDVYTTVNIQHIESRNDQIAQITSVIVQETVPDSILANADQIEFVDLSPKELLRRLQEGKVYLGDKAERAAQNFFKEEHLTALRELALRFTAEKVDQELQDQMLMKGIEGPWNTNERLLVAISHSPYSSRLIRATRRMAYSLESPWVVLYVDTGEVLKPEDQAMLKKHLALARELGAEVVTLADTSITGAIHKICREKNVTQIVMGRPDRRFFKDFFSRGTLLDQLVRITSSIDVHVIRAERRPVYRGFRVRIPKLASGWVPYYYTAWYIIAVSFVCYAAIPFVGYQALGSVFLLAILVVASLATQGPILFAAILSALIWDFYFIPPHFTFAIREYHDIMMVLTYIVVALVGGKLTSKIRKQEKILRVREEKSRRLYELSKKISEARQESAILDVLIGTLEDVLEGDVVPVLSSKSGVLDFENSQRKMDEKDQAVAQWVFEQRKSAGWSTQTLAGSRCLCLPMKGRGGAIGVLCYFPRKRQKKLDIEQEGFIDVVLSQIAIAVERLRYSEAAQAAKIYELSEKVHQTLISSVSHELRTPIAAIMASSTALQDPTTAEDKDARTALTDEMVKSSKRLNRVVENLLDVSRLENERLSLNLEKFTASELFEQVRIYLKDELDGRILQINGDLDVTLTGDFRLLVHAFANIVSNSLVYSKGAVTVQIHSLGSKVEISVLDEGPGLPPGSENHIFEKFFRVSGSPAGGLGLGLSIVKSIFEMHGGHVRAQNRVDRSGLEVVCELLLQK
ncbi:MAG: sensor histidine kinase KdpD [Bdellovibrio sp.]|nr:sensor histidine kinase KdpD [Bdellovibrio sp.]